MRKMIVVDPELCAGCRVCEISCSAAHYNVFQPSKSRISIVKYEALGIDIPVLCQQCKNAPCMAVCPVDAINPDPATGAMIVDESRCIGCRACMSACPFGAVNFDVDKGKPIICDLCGGNPKCVEICPSNALEYIEATSAAFKKRRESAAKLSKFLGVVLTEGGAGAEG